MPELQFRARVVGNTLQPTDPLPFPEGAEVMALMPVATPATTTPAVERAAEAIHRIYDLVAELEALFPGRHFTPDGHLIGSFGEVWAEYMYGLVLLPSSNETHDARSADGKAVQVKATQRDRVALTACPEHLIVLHLEPTGRPIEVYNGPGAPAWMASGKMQKNGQRPVRISTLRRLMKSVPPDARVPCLRYVATLTPVTSGTAALTP